MSIAYFAPALWGAAGAFCYAIGRLISVLLGEAMADGRAVRRAWATFFAAILFGPIAAQGFGPTLADWAGPVARPEAVWLVVGLSVNGAWPTIERLAWPATQHWIGEKLKALGAAISGETKP